MIDLGLVEIVRLTNPRRTNAEEGALAQTISSGHFVSKSQFAAPIIRRLPLEPLFSKPRDVFEALDTPVE
jgi:hypothetical protein